MTRRIPAAVLAVLLVTVACGHDHKTAARHAKPAETTGPYAVGVRTFNFVDDSRPLDANDHRPDAPRRTIITNVWYPAKGQPSDVDTPDAPAAPGPFPLIVFSHGQSGEPQQYASSLRLWARAGYVVAAPRHPLTVRGVPPFTGTADIQNQPADVSFVITGMHAELPKDVDIGHVAVAGHSSGAITALGAAFNTCCRDARIDAVVLEAVVPLPFKGGTYFGSLPAKPVLFFHGDADTTFPIAAGHGVSKAPGRRSSSSRSTAGRTPRRTATR